MPKTAKIPPTLRQRWLEEHDRGARIDDLARASQRTTRTVTTHIELARREREQRDVRGGLLREATLRHMEDLLAMARRLREAEDATQVPVLREPYDVATSLLLEGLHRHLPRSPLWKAREQWVKAIGDRGALRQAFEVHWNKKTGKLLAPLLPALPDIQWASGLWLAAEPGVGTCVRDQRGRVVDQFDGPHAYPDRVDRRLILHDHVEPAGDSGEW